MSGTIYSFDDPRTRAAMRRFNQARQSSGNSTCKLTYKQIYDLLFDPKVSLAEIARKAGIANQTMSVIYDNYFCEVFGNQLPLERQKESDRIKREEREREIREEAYSAIPWLGKIREGAQKNGLKTETVLRDSGFGRVSRSLIVVSGHLTQVHPIKHSHRKKSGGMPYGLVRLRRTVLEESLVQLFPVVVPGVRLGTYVIPSDMIAKTHFEEDPEVAIVHLPLRGRRDIVTRCRPRLDMSHYLNNWSPFKTLN